MGFRGLGVFSVQGVGFRDGCGLGYRDVWDLRFGVWSSGVGGLGNRVSGALNRNSLRWTLNPNDNKIPYMQPVKPGQFRF